MSDDRAESYVCLHCVVRGVVQGVGFRWFVAEHAQRLGIVGWVRNRRDGQSVEFAAVGARDQLRQLLARVREGPAGSVVESIEDEWRTPDQTYNAFEIRT